MGGVAQCRTSAAARSEPPGGTFPPTELSTGTAHAAVHIPRASPALSGGLRADRVACPPATPPSLGPRVPPRDDAEMPNLAGNRRHDSGRIRNAWEGRPPTSVPGHRLRMG